MVYQQLNYFLNNNIDAGVFAVAGMSALFTATVGAPCPSYGNDLEFSSAVAINDNLL